LLFLRNSKNLRDLRFVTDEHNNSIFRAISLQYSAIPCWEALVNDNKPLGSIKEVGNLLPKDSGPWT
jgi:hypothetical protein